MEFLHILLIFTASVINEFSFTAGQTELPNFEALVDFAHNEVGSISVVIHHPHCGSNIEVGHLHTVLHFDSWLSYDHGNGTQRFRTTKHFINDDGEWIFLIFQTYNNNVTDMIVRHFSADFQLNVEHEFQCEIGEGAFFFASAGDEPADELNEYKDLKQALLEGKEINVKAVVNECEGYNLAYDAVTNSRWIGLWEITNEGLDNETTVVTWDVWIDHHLDTAPAGVEKIVAQIRPDGSVQYLPLIFDHISWNEGYQLGEGFQCRLGSSFLAFTLPEAATGPVVTYNTYEEIAQGLEVDRDVAVMIDAKNCEWDSPDGPYYPTIYSQSFPFWVAHRQEESEFVSFFDYSTGPTGEGTGLLLQQQYAVSQDNSVSVVLHRIDPITKSLVRRDVGSCQLGSGAVLRSQSRERNVLETFDDLAEVLMQGKRVSWYADLNTCEGFLGGVTVEAGGTFQSGVAFDPMLNNGTFFGPVIQLSNPDDNSEKFAWSAISINWVAESLVIFFHEHDLETFEDNLEGQGLAQCEIGFPDVYLYW